MDAATRRNLELTETLRGEPAPTLFSLLDDCATGMGSRLLRHWLHHPLRDRAVLADAPRGGGRTDRALGRARRSTKLLRRIADVERITARIALKSARPRDLSGLRDSLALLPELARSDPGDRAAARRPCAATCAAPGECLALLAARDPCPSPRRWCATAA